MTFFIQQQTSHHAGRPVNILQIHGPPSPAQQPGMQDRGSPLTCLLPRDRILRFSFQLRKCLWLHQRVMWDDTYLTMLGTQDLRQLRELLARSNPEVVMPLKEQSPFVTGGHPDARA